MEKITEQSGLYRHLEQMPTGTILRNINREDQKVALAVEQVIPQITTLVDAVFNKMNRGGRLFYTGAGTSGRLGILDASECPPTFGVPKHLVVGLIAGGDKAIRNATEHVEDDRQQGWLDLKQLNVQSRDMVIGISASGTTPYVVAALQSCQENGIATGCITNNPKTPLADFADYPIVVDTGEEFVSGSTRMKAGTAQKMVLNMISTAVMIRLGHVLDNKMVDMQLNNAKLMERATKMLMGFLNISEQEAKVALKSKGSVRAVLEHSGIKQITK